MIKVLTNGAVVGTIVPPTAGLSSPQALAVDGSGNLYVAEYPPRVSKVTPTGIVSDFVTPIASPTGLAVDGSGNLFISNAGTYSLSEATPGGALSTFIPQNGGLSLPVGLAFDGSGNLYVANQSDNTIGKVAPSGTVSLFVPA